MTVSVDVRHRAASSSEASPGSCPHNAVVAAGISHLVGGSHVVDGVLGEGMERLPDLRFLAGLVIILHHLEIPRLERRLDRKAFCKLLNAV